MKTKKQYFKQIWNLNMKIHRLTRQRDRLISDCQKDYQMTYKQLEIEYALNLK